MKPLRAALLLAFAAAACGPMVEGGDPPRLAAADTIVAAVDPANVVVTSDTMTIGGGDTVTTATVTDTTIQDDPDPEPRPGVVGCRRAGTQPPRDAKTVDDVLVSARFS